MTNELLSRIPDMDHLLFSPGLVSEPRDVPTNPVLPIRDTCPWPLSERPALGVSRLILCLLPVCCASAASGAAKSPSAITDRNALRFMTVFCVVKYGTSKRLGERGHSEALKGFVSRDSEIAAPLTNSRPEPNAEAASSHLAGNRSSEEHTVLGGGENGRQFLGGRPALQGHGEA
jgi:hypothetical protein